jgi:hypothetical protein
MKYISYQTIDGDIKNINVGAMTDEQIINEIVYLQKVGESGAEPPLQNITLCRDEQDYTG